MHASQETPITTNTASSIIFVTYAGTREAPFDRHCYLDTHLPLVMKAWQTFGLGSATAFLPAVEQSRTIAIAELRFREEAVVQAALAAAETPEVMGDIANFTDVEPAMVRAFSL